MIRGWVSLFYLSQLTPSWIGPRCCVTGIALLSVVTSDKLEVSRDRLRSMESVDVWSGGCLVQRKKIIGVDVNHWMGLDQSTRELSEYCMRGDDYLQRMYHQSNQENRAAETPKHQAQRHWTGNFAADPGHISGSVQYERMPTKYRLHIAMSEEGFEKIEEN
ncbi:uncharacterized protein LY89DRAFT_675136 [Mollisia scopiformis]|uniref:Uncharacterized protein n=1 Tax=Mollisia scopiformis TaxID=149040 RepID=A0A132BE50_MOLSC|nr:uncharacterized protein LY89DRAFT_675136 [Mollisia scopiformis]KUJ10279.1 hypothetical protein LY89DRAFT_675136 [Mollisia scopiformis]